MKTVYLNATVIDGTENMEEKIADIVVEDGKISFIGKAGKKELHGAERIDCTGKFIMPGLINMHAHLFGTGKPSKILGGGGLQKLVIDFTHTKPGHKVLDALVTSAVKNELYSGVTTLRSVGDFEESDLRVRDKIRAGKLEGPRMFSSGAAITVPTGHGDGTFADVAEDPKDLAALVDKRKEAGADFIKICVTGGVMDAKEKGSPGELKMNLEQTKAVCDRAHEYGMIVASHTESPAGMEVAILGGVDTVEHSAAFSPELGKVLKDRNGALIITCSPALPLARISPEITKLNDICVYNSEVVMDGMIEGSKCAKKYGIQVGLGTDASCPFAAQYNMWRELFYYHKLAGVSTREAVYSATLSNARILGVDDITGSIEVGKFADMLILDNNPLNDLTALKDVNTVILEGKAVNGKPKKDPFIEEHLDEMSAAL
ncbi:MAG: amidohydrolase family protein [Clostridia bacterium]|nr:amidohydrolase family protein [Clostridia bacterium]